MVLSSGAGFLLWVMVFGSICLTPTTQYGAKSLNICADNAGGGASVIARCWESGGELDDTVAPHAGRMSGARQRNTARVSKGRMAFETLTRGPPRRGGLRRRVTRLPPAFPSSDCVGGYIPGNNRNITGQRPESKIFSLLSMRGMWERPGEAAQAASQTTSPSNKTFVHQTGVLSAAELPRGLLIFG